MRIQKLTTTTKHNEEKNKTQKAIVFRQTKIKERINAIEHSNCMYTLKESASLFYSFFFLFVLEI